MRARIAHHLAQLVDDGLRRRQVGIAHAEVDDVGAARAGAGLQPVDLLEHVRRQPADLVKFFHDQFLFGGQDGPAAIYTQKLSRSREQASVPLPSRRWYFWPRSLQRVGGVGGGELRAVGRIGHAGRLSRLPGLAWPADCERGHVGLCLLRAELVVGRSAAGC